MAREVLVKSVYICIYIYMYLYIYISATLGYEVKTSYHTLGMEISTRLILKNLFFKVWTCLPSMYTFWNLCAIYECDSTIFFRLLVTRWFIIIWLVFYLWVIPDASCCISNHFLDSLLLNKKSGNASESQMLNMRIFMNNCLDPALTKECHI